MMLRRTFVFAAVVLVLSLAGTVPAQAKEKKLKRSDLPPAVEKTVVEVSKGATIRGFSQEIENGKTFYEVELTVGGHGKDVLIDADGKVVEVEEQVALDSLPPAVKKGLETAAGKGKILRVESLTKRGALVAYEAVVRTGMKKSEIQVGPDGKPLAKKE